jgi:predicted lipoprotein with Yx(FWY)xxD motif
MEEIAMRNQWQAAGLLAAAAFLAAACGPNSSSSSGSGYGSAPSSQAAAPKSSTATLMLKTAATSAGTILANAGGYVLYYYTADKPGSGTSACTGSCTTAWPPLTGTVQAPTGMTLPGPLGTITLANGTKQVTINGYPIYLYAGDHSPGQDKGNGVGGQWHVIKISGSSSSSGTQTAVTLKTAQTSAGTILTSAGGFALYYYSQDKPGSGTSACTGGCTTAWPPLTAAVQAPPGVKLPGPLGTITLANGTKQVTINGYPIYLYAGDHSPGQDNGNGVGGQWHVIKISGSSSSSSSTSGGSYGGGGY